MAEGYYKILQVDKNARDDDLKKAFKKFANQNKESEANFKRISEAYEVLRDPMKRAIYDQYGAEGLRVQGSSPDADRPYLFTGSGSGTRYVLSNGQIRPVRDDDIFSELLGSLSPFAWGPQKAPPIENRLACSLEDLYNGITKKMKISRDIVDINGKTLKVEEILNIEVKRGWKKGTKITFPEKGNVKPNIIASDVVFIIDEKPHSVFTRDENDLIVTKEISVVEAFTGYTIRLATLDGRTLSIHIDDVIHPNYEKVVTGEGMPFQNDPPRKGNLRIKFNINFPRRLTAEQKAAIKSALGTSA